MGGGCLSPLISRTSQGYFRQGHPYFTLHCLRFLKFLTPLNRNARSKVKQGFSDYFRPPGFCTVYTWCTLVTLFLVSSRSLLYCHRSTPVHHPVPHFQLNPNRSITYTDATHRPRWKCTRESPFLQSFELATLVLGTAWDNR